ncbi:MAG: NUDIX domain-containing protein [Clostridiales bacterium]|nr:NUDIX domain-containing protein [Clostridiales bacterium]
MGKEKWDVYDIHRVKTGDVVVRGTKPAQGQFRMVVHICIFNSKGQMLIQQRVKDKDDWADLWDVSVGGCSRSGETSQDAAHREVSEELGLDIDFEGVVPRFTINWEHGFDDYYVLKQDLDPATLILQPEEVQAVKWATRDEILDLIRKDRFITYHESLINMLFEMRGGYGAHSSEKNR